jgi:TrmH RNA methyltransferase
MKAGRSRTLHQSGGVHPPHERELLRICGLAAVRALFERDPSRVERLFFEDRMKGEVGPFCQMLACERKPFVRSTRRN